MYKAQTHTTGTRTPTKRVRHHIMGGPNPTNPRAHPPLTDHVESQHGHGTEDAVLAWHSGTEESEPAWARLVRAGMRRSGDLVGAPPRREVSAEIMSVGH